MILFLKAVLILLGVYVGIFLFAWGFEVVTDWLADDVLRIER